MLKNQRGFGIMDFLGILMLTALILAYTAIPFSMGKGIGHQKAMGTPIQFELEELEKDVSYILIEKLSSPSKKNFSVIINSVSKTEKIKIVENLPENIKPGTVFIIKDEGIFIKE